MISDARDQTSTECYFAREYRASIHRFPVAAVPAVCSGYRPTVAVECAAQVIRLIARREQNNLTVLLGYLTMVGGIGHRW